mgnify:CR=1 FL=1
MADKKLQEIGPDKTLLLVDDDELAKMGFKKYKKSVNRIQHLWMSFLSKIGIDHLVDKHPVPADWEYIKEPFLHNLEPVLDDAKRLFPDELEKITIEDFKINPNLDSRSFRFYSLMKFITYCNSKGVSFK